MRERCCAHVGCDANDLALLGTVPAADSPIEIFFYLRIKRGDIRLNGYIGCCVSQYLTLRLKDAVFLQLLQTVLHSAQSPIRRSTTTRRYKHENDHYQNQLCVLCHI